MESKEVDAFVRKRLDDNIRKGNFSAISNIPYELSRLQQEIDSLKTQIRGYSEYHKKAVNRRVPSNDFNAGLIELKRRLKSTLEVKELLNKHREGQGLQEQPEPASQADDENMRDSQKEKSLEEAEEAKIMKKASETI